MTSATLQAVPPVTPPPAREQGPQRPVAGPDHALSKPDDARTAATPAPPEPRVLRRLHAEREADLQGHFPCAMASPPAVRLRETAEPRGAAWSCWHSRAISTAAAATSAPLLPSAPPARSSA